MTMTMTTIRRGRERRRKRRGERRKEKKREREREKEREKGRKRPYLPTSIPAPGGAGRLRGCSAV